MKNIWRTISSEKNHAKKFPLAVIFFHLTWDLWSIVENQHEFELPWAAKVRHIKDYLVENAAFDEKKTPTIAYIHEFLKNKFPRAKIKKPTKRVEVLDLWQKYCRRLWRQLCQCKTLIVFGCYFWTIFNAWNMLQGKICSELYAL